MPTAPALTTPAPALTAPAPAPAPAQTASATRTPIFSRPETILGVCESLGDDFGISGNWFRAALFPLILWQPLWTVVGYLVLAGVVLASRLIFPDVRPAPDANADADTAATAIVAPPSGEPSFVEPVRLAA